MGWTRNFDTRPWAVACTYTTLLLYGTAFLIFIPFVCHPGVLDGVPVEPSSPPGRQMVYYQGTSVYGAICGLCFASLFIALLSLLCIVGIHKGRCGLLIPYLVVMGILALVLVAESFFTFYYLHFMDYYASMARNSEKMRIYATELTEVIKAIVVLMTLLSNWLFITPVVVVGRHCHRLRTDNANGYASVPPREGPSYGYDVKSAGVV